MRVHPSEEPIPTLNVMLVENGELGNMHLGDLDVESYNVSTEEYDVAITLSDFHAELSGVFRTHNGTDESMEGNATLVVSDVSLKTTLRFIRGEHGIPNKLKFEDCNVPDLSITIKDCKSTTDPLTWWYHCEKDDAEIAVLERLAKPVICSFIVKIGLELLIDPVLKNFSETLLAGYVALPIVAPPVSAGEDDTAHLDGTANMNTPGVISALKTFKGVFNVPGTGRFPYTSRYFAGDVVKEQPLVVNQLVDVLMPDHALTHLNLSLPEIVIKEGAFSGVKLGITVKDVSLVDMDSITLFDVANVLANHTIGLTIGVSSLSLGVTLEVNMVFPDNVLIGGGEFTLETAMELDLKDMVFGLNVVAGLNATELQEVQMGSLLSLATLPACLLQTIKATNLTFIHSTLGDMKMGLTSKVIKPVLHPAASGGMNSFFANTISALGGLYGDSMLPIVPYLADRMMRPVLNAQIQAMLADKKPCVFPDRTSKKKTKEGSKTLRSAEGEEEEEETVLRIAGDVDLSQSVLIKILDTLFDTVLGDFESDMSVNDFIAASLSQSDNWNGTALNLGTLVNVSGKFIQGGTPADVYMGMLKLVVSEVSVSGLPSFGNLSVLLPGAGPFNLNNFLRLAASQDAFGNAQDDPLRLSARIYIRWEEFGPLIENDVRISVNIADWGATLDAILKIVDERFVELELQQATQASCLYSAMDHDGLKIDLSEMLVKDLTLEVECISCTGQTLIDWSKKLETSGPAWTNTINGFFNMTFNKLSGALASSKLRTFQEEAVCGTPMPSIAPDHTTIMDSGKYVQLAMILTAVLACVMMPVFTVYKVRQALNGDPEAKVTTECQRDGEEDPDSIEDDTSSIDDAGSVWDTLRMGETVFAHPVVPAKLRYGVPVMLIILMGLMLSSHLYYENITIDAVFVIGGQTKQMPVYKYTTLKLIKDGWNAHVPDISVGIGFLSFTWAWIKIVALFWLFFVPPTVLSHSTRSHLLAYLDYAAKFSLLDTLLNLLLVPYGNILVGPSGTLPGWGDEVLMTGLKVERWYGYYVFALVQGLNLLIGQIVLFHNRNVVASVKKEMRDALTQGYRGSWRSQSSARSMATTTWFAEGAKDTTREVLSTHLHSRRKWLGCCVAHKSGDTTRPSPLAWYIRCLVFLSMLACMTLHIVGVLVNSMGVEDTGVLGLLADVTPGVVCLLYGFLFDIICTMCLFLCICRF